MQIKQDVNDCNVDCTVNIVCKKILFYCLLGKVSVIWYNINFTLTELSVNKGVV